MADDEETSEQTADPEAEIEVHFKPIVDLKPVEIKTLEDNEDEVFKIRARLYRFDVTSEPPEWKERGTGDIRMLKNRQTSQVRLVMRREKTLKICCNHYLTSNMQLKSHCESDRAFVWTTCADFSDEEAKQELLAIKFRDAENAQKFKVKFEELQEDLPNLNRSFSENSNSKREKEDGVIEKLADLTVKDSTAENNEKQESECDTNTSGETEKTD